MVRTATPTPAVLRSRKQAPGAGRTGRAAYRTSRYLARRAHHHRRRLAPIAAVAAQAAAGGLLSVPADGWKTAIALNGLAAVTFTGWVRHRRMAKRPLRRSQLLWAAAGTGTAGILLVRMALAGGPLPPNTGFLALWLAVFGTRWWYRHRIRPGKPTTAVSREDIWAKKIAASGGALPDSALHDVKDLPNAGWGATIQLNGMRQSTAAALAATTGIAAALKLPVTSIAVERHESARADLATIQVYETNPLISLPTFPGPGVLDPSTGIAELGLHIDGTPAKYQMWVPGWGAVHDFISGATGSGKSGLATSLFAIERHSGLCVSWGGDPQGGKSFGFWQDYLDYFAPGVDEIMGMLLAADAELTRRSAGGANHVWYDADGDAMYGETDFTPSAEPGKDKLLVITIDEWEHVWQAYPQALDIAVRLATEGRKCGIKLRILTHLATLDALGTEKLRQPLTAGNIIALRTTARSASYVIDLPADPNDIPKSWPGMPGSRTSGLGYLKSVEDRAATYRGWQPEPKEIATRWAKTGTLSTLEEKAADNCGPVYTEWRERLAARRRGEIQPVPGVNDQVDESAEDDPAYEAATPKKSGPQLRDHKVSLGSLDAQIAANQKPAAGAKKQAIVAYLHRVGTATTGLIIRDTGVAEGTASSTLGRLEKEGLVIRVGQGVWAARINPTGQLEESAA